MNGCGKNPQYRAFFRLAFGKAFVRAIGCNWMVCLAVWMALAARETVGKIFAIFFPVGLVLRWKALR